MCGFAGSNWNPMKLQFNAIHRKWKNVHFHSWRCQLLNMNETLNCTFDYFYLISMIERISLPREKCAVARYRNGRSTKLFIYLCLNPKRMLANAQICFITTHRGACFHNQLECSFESIMWTKRKINGCRVCSPLWVFFFLHFQFVGSHQGCLLEATMCAQKWCFVL